MFLHKYKEEKKPTAKVVKEVSEAKDAIKEKTCYDFRLQNLSSTAKS